jgi:hypothetical protein
LDRSADFSSLDLAHPLLRDAHPQRQLELRHAECFSDCSHPAFSWTRRRSMDERRVSIDLPPSDSATHDAHRLRTGRAYGLFLWILPAATTHGLWCS